MELLTQKMFVKEKVERMKKGYSAYAESPEMASLLKKEISKLKLKVYEDITEMGSWFIPETSGDQEIKRQPKTPL
ncbi:hypothetical protein J9317_14580 [Metabacillus sp. KIGAM252]|uniref:Fur-regulated basic protein FbpA n=1 Tax=Metabacillus flavus TaxID=2823519 RepID=A0ABS5LHZ1_9BACI|nr:hypothetical protein [Metabacillus flavus]MBS2969994.1 hypothetical protein [Metabacillus flavus]